MVISDRQMGHPQLAAKSGALSCRFSHFHVSHFPPLQHGAAFSCPAISCLAFSASPYRHAYCLVKFWNVESKNFPLQNADGLQTHLAPLVILALQIRIVLTIVGIHKLYNLLTYCSILFFSCPRSEGWLHHWRTFFHLSLSCHTD